MSNVSYLSSKELKYRARMPIEEKFTILKAFIGIEDDKVLASRLQCSTRTIGRIKKEFYESEGYKNYVRDRVHVYLATSNRDIPEIEKFRALVSIYRDMLNGRRVDDTKEVTREDERRVLEALRQFNAALTVREKT